ncbi:hypothetical protein MTR_0032s0070 [Medicago truncatula]|uniref:Uncharacterized protein n=1 Tax=Medicago truncatula TaxID=3880 RepID=A0A072TIZ7_MEDTR|nr:hypothetical protein MTR_0032s0070 [Medicago truncatula]
MIIVCINATINYRSPTHTHLSVKAIKCASGKNIIIKMNITTIPYFIQQLDDDDDEYRTLILGQYFKIYFPDRWRISLNAAKIRSPTA